MKLQNIRTRCKHFQELQFRSRNTRALYLWSILLVTILNWEEFPFFCSTLGKSSLRGPKQGCYNLGVYCLFRLFDEGFWSVEWCAWWLICKIVFFFVYSVAGWYRRWYMGWLAMGKSLASWFTMLLLVSAIWPVAIRVIWFWITCRWFWFVSDIIGSHVK